VGNKFYEFHYAVIKAGNIESLGILNYSTNKSITKEDLKAYTRDYLNMPGAVVMISHILKLRRLEYEELTGQNLT